MIRYFFFYFKCIYFNWRIITLQYCDGFCHTAAWNGHKHTRDPPSWTPLPLPSPPGPSGLSQTIGCPASCIKLALAIYLHMIMYMFQCYSLKSSQPHLLPLSPKVYSLHLCLLCCPACRIIGTIFLNDISIHFKPITISLAMIVTIHTCHHITFLLIIFPTLYIYITLCTLLHYMHYLHMTHLFATGSLHVLISLTYFFASAIPCFWRTPICSLYL